MEKNKTCKDCKFAKWQRTASGRIATKKYGECTVELPLSNLPACVPKPLLHKVVIWCDQLHNCPLHEKVEK